MNIITSNKYFNAAIVALGLIAVLSNITIAAPDHHVELSGKACIIGGKTYVEYTATSWAMTGSGGLNDSIKLEEQHIIGGQSSSYNYITTGSFTDANGRQFSNQDGQPFVIDGTASKVKLISTVQAKWKNGSSGGQVNTFDIIPSLCVTPTATSTSTQEPTATFTPVPPTATNTPEATATYIAPTPDCEVVLPCGPTNDGGVNEPGVKKVYLPIISSGSVSISTAPATPTRINQ